MWTLKRSEKRRSRRRPLKGAWMRGAYFMQHRRAGDSSPPSLFAAAMASTSLLISQLQ
jgi:hypothetical protein